MTVAGEFADRPWIVVREDDGAIEGAFATFEVALAWMSRTANECAWTSGADDPKGLDFVFTVSTVEPGVVQVEVKDRPSSSVGLARWRCTDLRRLGELVIWTEDDCPDEARP